MLASRRSTVAVFGSGAALSLTGLASGSVRASSSHRVVVPGGGFPYLPGQRLPAVAAGRHALLRVQVVSRGDVPGLDRSLGLAYSNGLQIRSAMFWLVLDCQRQLVILLRPAIN